MAISNASKMPARPQTFQFGLCRFCGCTDDRACPGGCWWHDCFHTVCSNTNCVMQYRVLVDHAARSTGRLEAHV